MKKQAMTEPPQPNLDQADRLVDDLLRIPGPSGREGPVAEFIIDKLRQAGVPASAIHTDSAHRRGLPDGRVGNLCCKLPGTIPGRRRLLSAHMDTVPLCVGVEPVARGDWIVPADKSTALGADDRAGVAAVLGAALEVVRRKLPHPPLTFLWTVQEEVGLRGARHARLGMLGNPRLAFNFDGGSAEKLTIGATGGYRLEIKIHGVASHAGCAPEEGVSAITIASLAVAELHRDGWLGQISKNGKSGTSNVGVIQGGDATNVVTPLVDVRAEARSHNKAFRRRIVRAIERAFRKAARSVKNNQGERGAVEIDGRLDYEAFRLTAGEPCVAAAEAAVRSTGGEPLLAVCDGGLDANWLTARLVPTVSFGCGAKDAHTTKEKLYLPEFHRACRIALRLATATENG